MSEEKFVIHQVPQAVIDHLLPDDIDPRIELSPIVLLDVPKHDPKMIYFTTPGRDDSIAHRYLTGASVGKSEPSWKLLENMVTLNHVAIGNGERTLFGEFPHPELIEPRYPDYPTFTWTEKYSLSDGRRLRASMYGYHGEAKPRGEQWMNGFALRYFGFQAPAMWDHYEWLGDERLHHTERLSSIDRFRRSVLRVRVPARRYAGLNAYELDNLFYLKEKKPLDTYSHWIVRHVTGMDYYWEREKWFHSLIQSGLDVAFKVAKKPIAQRMSARPRIKR